MQKFASYGEHRATKGRLSTPPLRRTLRLAVQSIRLRFGRCLVTMASVVSAIAFLAYNALYLGDATVGRDSGLPSLQAQAPSPGFPLSAGGGQDFFAGLEAFTAEKNIAQKRMFVVVLAIFVCFVGIANSMLMSVRERFREIATLKCVGAVNAYIRQLFVIESLLQGAIGSFLGLVLGAGIFLLARGASLSVAWLAKVSVASMALGVVMTLLASIWPIREALAMMPVEALRVEE